jgi:hypothetical protein
MTESSNYTAGGLGSPSRDSAALADVKYLSIAKINEDRVLLNLPSSTTKKAYAEEVSTIVFLKLLLKYRKEAKTIVDGLRETTAYPDLRDSSESVYGIWYTSVDRNMIAYSGI